MTKTDVINYFGNKTKTARALRISYQAVKNWPVELTDRIAFRVELVTNGALKTNETLLMEQLKNDNR
jgi:hypothetical protein